ncbi:unnamed protein product [Coffea canephora]|uniref:Signal recognition particle 14 kDa protein n=1 Tax=Coffea canephora TaxID=49390 RepID=A0A068TXA5_COFCA|nr:unnamed protein product [Coffea canephora]
MVYQCFIELIVALPLSPCVVVKYVRVVYVIFSFHYFNCLCTIYCEFMVHLWLLEAFNSPFLNELTNMFERITEKGSVWVTLKYSSDKSKLQRNKMKTAGEKIEYKCLIRATDVK